MKVNPNIGAKIFRGEDGDRLSFSYDNRGEPFREGITIELQDGDYNSVHVFLEEREVKELKEFLNDLCENKS